MEAVAANELRRLGGDPGSFRSRPLGAAHCETADLILAATTEHRSAVLEMVPRALKRTFTLLKPRCAAVVLTTSDNGTTWQLSDCFDGDSPQAISGASTARSRRSADTRASVMMQDRPGAG